MTRIHHTAVCVRDMDASLRFYRDGIGLHVLADKRMDADLGPLLGVGTTSFRMVFLGADGDVDSGIVELIDMGDAELASESVQSGLPARGVFLLSIQAEVQAVLDRLAALNLGGTPRTMMVPTGMAATVVDPDGVMVELLPPVPLTVFDRNP